MNSAHPTSLVQPLFEGPIDIVGDVHGEIDALEALLERLGYPQLGEHPEGRRLVYVGDLIDRGTDSPAVVERVMRQVEDGIAQCILGNHELNILRTTNAHRVEKHGNHWYWSQPERTAPNAAFFGSRGANSDQRTRFKDFFHGLPLALERKDLRVVHACWDPDALAKARKSVSALDLYLEYEKEVQAKAEESGMKERGIEQRKPYKDRMRDPRATVPFLDELAQYQTWQQIGNPVKLLSSGPEEPLPPGEKPYHVGGKWRMTVRVPWWERYQQSTPVIFGHYWRKPDPESGEPDEYNVLGEVSPVAWLGPRQNCYCVDLSVGRRYKERISEHVSGRSIGCLAALRLPEWRLIMDDRSTLQLSPPGP